MAVHSRKEKERPTDILDWLELWRTGNAHISPLDDAKELERMIERIGDLGRFADDIIIGIARVVKSPSTNDFSAIRFQAMSLAEHVACRTEIGHQNMRLLVDAALSSETHWPHTALVRLLSNPRAIYERSIRSDLFFEIQTDGKTAYYFKGSSHHASQQIDKNLLEARVKQLAESIPKPFVQPHE